MSSLPLFIHENETRILHWINAFYANDIYNIAATIEKNINEIFLSAGELLQKSLNNIVASILAFTSSMVNLILGLFISFYF
jgi:predicted PurR-regulated permease PerM